MTQNDKLKTLVLDLTNILDEIDQIQPLLTAVDIVDAYINNWTLSNDMFEAYQSKMEELITKYKSLASVEIRTS